MYTKWMRDYVKSFIPDIKIIHIKVDVALLLPKNRIRLTKAMDKHNMSLADMYNRMTDDETKSKYGKEYSEEVFDKYMTGEFYCGFQEYQPDETNMFTINNNEYGKPGIAELRRIVGLTGDFEYDPDAIENVQ